MRGHSLAQRNPQISTMVNKAISECRMMLDGTMANTSEDSKFIVKTSEEDTATTDAKYVKCSRSHRNQYSSLVVLLFVTLLVAIVVVDQTAADEKPKGLFSQVNNWFSKLRANRDKDANNDDKKEEKKEEATTKSPMGMYGPGIQMPPGFPPHMGPYGGMMGASGPTMYGPMSMSSPFGMAPGRPHGPPMSAHPHGMPMSYSPMGHMQMSPMSNPFAFSGSHTMP